MDWNNELWRCHALLNDVVMSRHEKTAVVYNGKSALAQWFGNGGYLSI